MSLLPPSPYSPYWVVSDYHGYYERILTREGFNMERVSPLDRYDLTKKDVLFWWRSPFLREKVRSETEKLFAFWLFS